MQTQTSYIVMHRPVRSNVAASTAPALAMAHTSVGLRGAQVGELATERVLRIAKAAEAARRLGQEAARAAGELELGAGDGVGTCCRPRSSVHSAASSCRCVPALAHLWMLYVCLWSLSLRAEAKRKQAEAAAAAAAAQAPPTAASLASAASSGGSYDGDAGVVYSDGAQAAEGQATADTDAEPRGSKACTVQ
eukprot:COSAG06_NODE_8589_length_2122_cov_3.394958_4_plen_192_part_00